MERQGKTAYWLADQARITLSAAYRLAADDAKRVDLDTLNRVCDALGVEPGDLFERSPKRGTK